MRRQILKKTCALAALWLAFSGARAAAQNSVPFSGVEISFTFIRQGGSASNQFAVWIEDSRGGFVKTLYATGFTASGGWKRRPTSIPRWVKRSGLSSLSESEIDTFTGATPRTETLSYRWNGTDKNGNPAPAGEYRVFLEATLRNENGVLYSAPFTLGSRTPAAAEVRAEYSGGNVRERDMIGNVRVLYRP